MDEFEDAFRSALSRIDVAPRPVATLEPAVVVARARETWRPVPRAALVRRLALVAAFLLVVGIGVAGWLGRDRPVPAGPAPSPSEAVPIEQALIGPLTPEPASGFTVVMDDAALVPGPLDPVTAPDVGEQRPIERVPELPGGYFVDGAAIYVDDQFNHQIVTYRDGRRVDAVMAPAENFAGFAVWLGTYYLLGDRLRAYVPENGRLVEVPLPEGLGNGSDVSELVVDGQDLVAVGWHGIRRLVAGPGPLSPVPTLSLTARAAMVVGTASVAQIRLEHEPIGITLLGRDLEHAWYQVCESWWEEGSGNAIQCYVVEFDRQGHHTASYTPVRDDTSVFSRDLAVGAGGVHQLVFTGRSVQVRQLQPIPDPERPAPAMTPTARPDGEVAAVLGEPPAGFRWVIYFPVDHPGEPAAVALPQDWISFPSPPRFYCSDGTAPPPVPPGPYVDRNHGATQGDAAECPALSDQEQQLHVSITDVGVQSDWSFPWAGGSPEWRQWSVALGHTIVTVTGRPSDEQLARRILATAQVVR